MSNNKTAHLFTSWLLASFIFLAILVSTIVPAYAAPTQDMMVTDDAKMLTSEQESEIEDMLYDINQQTGVEFAVYTIESLDGQDIETKANDLFRELGLGDSEKNNGLLLLIALNDRKFRLEVGYGLEGTIPDTKAAEIINTMTPYFKESNYIDGIKAAVSETISALNSSGDYNINIGSADKMQEAEDSELTPIIIFLGVLLGIFRVIIVLVLLALFCLIKYWIGGGGFSGGSWGGGSSGGGGASGGW